VSAPQSPHPVCAVPPDLDPDILDIEPMVRNFGGLGPIVATLYALFLKNANELAGAVRDQLTGDNPQAARMAAHAAAGAARMAGARRVAFLFSAIEEAIVRGNVEEARKIALALDDALVDVRSMIDRI
jgi:FOG: HPt domain